MQHEIMNLFGNKRRGTDCNTRGKETNVFMDIINSTKNNIDNPGNIQFFYFFGIYCMYHYTRERSIRNNISKIRKR